MTTRNNLSSHVVETCFLFGLTALVNHPLLNERGGGRQEEVERESERQADC